MDEDTFWLEVLTVAKPFLSDIAEHLANSQQAAHEVNMATLAIIETIAQADPITAAKLLVRLQAQTQRYQIEMIETVGNNVRATSTV